MKFSLVLAVLLLAFITACGSGAGNSLAGRSAANPQGETVGQTVTLADSAHLLRPAYSETAEEQGWWEILEHDPGIPGEHYDPLSTMVAFNPQGELPAGWAPASAAGLAAAQAQADPFMVREAPTMVAIAAAVAERYGLALNSQFYRDGMRTAFFSVPEGTDLAALMARMRVEGQGLIMRSVYEPLRHAAYTPNDPDYNLATNTTGYGPLWGHHKIKTGAAWDISLGSEDSWIVVADTGVQISHEELSAQCFDPAVEFPTYNLDVRNNDDTVDDTDGHGTFIAGLVSAQGDNGRTIIGVAPQCKVVPVKIANGGTTAQQYIINGCYKGLELFEDFPDKRVVVNLSWGGESGSPPEQNMVNALYNGGVLLVVAAGNDGSNTIGSFPSQYANCQSVGATGTDLSFQPSLADKNNRSAFSNYGNYVDIAAPGSWLKSCRRHNTANDRYEYPSQGTSFSAPIVAAAAALVWSIAPDLTVDEVRTALEDTGTATNGFSATAPVLQLDLEAALASVAGAVRVPQLDKVIQSGVVELTPQIAGNPNSVSCYVNGELLQTLTAAPWTFSIDTRPINFGQVRVEFRSVNGPDTISASLEFIADNTSGAFPVAEFFNQVDARTFAAADVKTYSPAFLTALKAQSGAWSAGQVASSGAGKWNYPAAGGYQGQGALLTNTANSAYDAYDIDVLISRKVNLAGVGTPTLAFRHKFNIQNGGTQLDKARVMVTADGGVTWAPAKLGASANNAVWSGSQADFILAEVNLSDFIGQSVHVALVFEADGSTSGEVAGPSGWWVDNLVVSRDFSTSVPTIESVVLTRQAITDPLPVVSSASVVGEALGIATFDVNITGPNQVANVLYWLDLANAGGSFGTIDLYDITKSVDGPGFLANLNVPKRKNQRAILVVQYFDAASNPGQRIEKDVYIFDLRGDTNADGKVDQADLDNYTGKVGLTAGDPGYSVFLDSDLDGTITEADASAVGYNWGKSS